jgi:hypothetical protein
VQTSVLKPSERRLSPPAPATTRYSAVTLGVQTFRVQGANFEQGDKIVVETIAIEVFLK